MVTCLVRNGPEQYQDVLCQHGLLEDYLLNLIAEPGNYLEEQLANDLVKTIYVPLVFDDVQAGHGQGALFLVLLER